MLLAKEARNKASPAHVAVLTEREACHGLYKLGLNIARALVCGMLQQCRHQWFGSNDQAGLQ